MSSIQDILRSLAGGSDVTFELAFFAIAFMTAALLIVGIGTLRRSDPLAKRLQSTKQAGDGAPRVSLRYGGSDHRMQRLLAPFLRAIPTDQGKLSAARRRLVQAGYYDPNAVQIFYGIRIALAFVLTPIVLLIVSLMVKNLVAYEMTAIALGSASLGFYLPLLFVANRVQHRQRNIIEGLPDALDLLLVCVEAGLGFDAALNRVASEIADTNPVLSEQLRLVDLEFRAGKARSDALRNLATRTGVDDVKSFVTLLVHSDKLGTSMAQSLRVHAADMRVKRLMRAEEKANKLPVKIIMPVGLCFLPCLLTLIFTPLIIRVLRVLAPALGA